LKQIKNRKKGEGGNGRLGEDRDRLKRGIDLPLLEERCPGENRVGKEMAKFALLATRLNSNLAEKGGRGGATKREDRSFRKVGCRGGGKRIRK